MKLAIALVLLVIALQLIWNLRRARQGLLNVRALSQKDKLIDDTMKEFGEQRELLKALTVRYAQTNRRSDSQTTWLVVEFWKEESIKRLCEFDFHGALALMKHAVKQAECLLVDCQSATPSVTSNIVSAFLERQRLKVELKTAPQLL